MKRKILIVEDEQLNRDLLVQCLEEYEYETLEATNGQEALNLLSQESSISAVILDIVMPIMDGYMLLKKIRSDENLAMLPVLVQTIDRQSEKEALTLGANDFIVKPFDIEVLLKRLGNLIELNEKSSLLNASKRDSLTGLYSRNTFLDKVEELVALAEEGYYVLTCFDIDNFKVINDLYGTQKGDEVLLSIADNLTIYFDHADGICCRTNADNFAILYPVAFMDTQKIKEIIGKVMDTGFMSTISFSIGRYIVNDKTLSASAMYDRAMMAKATIKGRYDQHIAIYEESMRKRILSEQEIVSEMNAALKKKQFEVWYQPQYNHETGALIGAEALVRWRHPEKGIIPPGIFIPIFEQNGFVYEIDKFVWEQCCIFLRQLMDEGKVPMPISVNISRYDIFQDGLSDFILKLIKKYKLRPELLRLEITESAFAKSSKQIIAVVQEFKQNGFLVEIDDFGSGYSSLNTLKEVPADVLKLDMKFLEGDIDSDKGGNIVASIVRMSKWIGMSIIAEGVETIQEANFLKSIGCFYIQGYLYSKPLPKCDYEKVLSQSNLEKSMFTLEKVETYDVEAFWNPTSMETLIFNSFVGGACVFELHDGRVQLLRVNDKYVKIVGHGRMTESQILDVNVMEYFSQEDLTRIQLCMQKAILTMEEVGDEIGFHDNSGTGEIAYVRSMIRVIAKSGDRYLFYCLIEDITEQRKAEIERVKAEKKELESAQRLQVIMHNINGGVSAIIIHEDGTSKLVFNNERYYELYGYTKEQALAENLDVMTLILPEDLEMVLKRNAQMKKDKKPAVFDYRCRRQDGKIVYLRANSSLMYIEDYGEEVIISVVTDITQQKLLSDQLQAIVDNINGGVMVTIMKQEQPEFLVVNNRYYEILGYTKEEYQSCCKDKYEQLYPEDRERVIRTFEQTTEIGKKYTIVYRIVRKDGTIRWIQNNISVMTIFGVEEPVQLAVATDITKERETQEQLRFVNESAHAMLTQPDYENAILAALDKIMSFYCADRVYVTEFDYTRKVINNIFEVCKKGVQSQKENRQGISYDDTSDWIMSMQRNELIKIADVDNLNSKPNRNQRLLQKQGVHAVILAPLFRENTLFGFIGIDNPTYIMNQFERLKTLGEYFTLLIIHKKIAEQSKTEHKRTEQMLSIALKTMMEASSDLSYVKNCELRYLCCSRSMAQTIGLTNPEEVIGKTDYELFDKEIADQFISEDRELMENNQISKDYIEKLPTRDGSFRLARSSKYPIRDNFGKVLGVYGISRDFTDQNEKEAIYRKWQQSFENRQSDSFSLIRCDLNIPATVVSIEGALIQYHYDGLKTFDECTIQYAEEKIHEDDREEYIDALQSEKLLSDFKHGQSNFTIDYREMLSDDNERWLRCSVDLFERPNSDGIMAYLTFENIDESKRLELSKQVLAETDSLTGLLNRKAFIERFHMAIKKCKKKSIMALFLIDMDGFKLVNDTFGHAMGDQVLVDTSHSIKSILRDYDIVGRLGGDEFLVCLCNVPDREIVRKKAKQILKMTHKAFNLDVQLSISLGIAIYPDDGRDFDVLYQKADKALYQIKESGKDNFAFYHEDYSDSFREIEEGEQSFILENTGAKRRLLLIDNKSNCMVISKILGDEFAIDSVKDSNTALNYLRRYGENVSLVLLNLEMAGLDGFMILNRIQHDKELQSIPVIIMNSATDHQTNLLAIRCGACDFVAYPIEDELLRFRIQTAISKSENQRLRIRNRYLTLLGEEMERYKAILKENGTVMIEYDTQTKAFLYDPSVGQLFRGEYDERSLWDIFEQDAVAEQEDINALKNLMTEVIEKNINKSKEINIVLTTTSNEKHPFRARALRCTKEGFTDNKLLIIFTDKV